LSYATKALNSKRDPTTRRAHVSRKDITVRIENTKEMGSDGIKIVVAGEAGNGKTTLARTLSEGLRGERICILSAEAGLLSLRGADIDVIDLQKDDDGKLIPKENRIERLAQIYQWLTQPEQIKKYRWIFIDSLTEINQNMLERLEADPAFQGQANTIKKYGELSTRMRGLAKIFRDLPHYNVVFTALVKEDKDSDQRTVVAIDMIGSFADKLPALFDEIFYLGVMKELDDRGRNKRLLMTNKDDKYKFPKDRSNALDKFEAPDLAAIAKKIRIKVAATAAGKPATSDKALSTPDPKPLVADISQAAKAAAKEAKAEKEARA
jgi:hypothetical protein